MLSYTRQQVYSVDDLKNLARIDFISFFPCLFCPFFKIHQVGFWKDIFIGVSDIKNRAIIRAEELCLVGVGTRPFVKVKSVLKHTRFHQRGSLDSHLEQSVYVLLKQKTRRKVVLVSANVLYNQFNGLCLIQINCTINSVSVEV